MAEQIHQIMHISCSQCGFYDWCDQGMLLDHGGGMGSKHDRGGHWKLTKGRHQNENKLQKLEDALFWQMLTFYWLLLISTDFYRLSSFYYLSADFYWLSTDPYRLSADFYSLSTDFSWLSTDFYWLSTGSYLLHGSYWLKFETISDWATHRPD